MQVHALFSTSMLLFSTRTEFAVGAREAGLAVAHARRVRAARAAVLAVARRARAVAYTRRQMSFANMP